MQSYQFIIYFLIIYTICGIAVKTYFLNAAEQSLGQRYKFLFFSPFYSTKTWSRCINILDRSMFQPVKKLIYLLLLSVLILIFYKAIITNYSQYRYIMVLASIIPFYIITELIGQFFQIVFLLFNKTIPGIHNKPFMAKNITQFWSNGWNIWVRDWLFEITPTRIRKMNYVNIIFPFFISGIWHEIIINIPLFIISKINIFGTMILYFLIQSLGVIADKKYFRIKASKSLRYLFCLFIAIAPSPLFFNEQLLKIFFFNLF